MYLFSFILF